MGVPSFYSWLKKRYPLTNYPIKKQHGQNVDFFYLDMNQVIYKCATNPNVLFKDYLRDLDFEQVWVTILNYINELIDLMQPQQGLFLTFDGVAPRAKTNQQRARRFASSKRDAKVQQELQALGLSQSNQTFKNNQITPGTEFMFELNAQVRYFIKRKFAEDPKYGKLKVIFSGSDVPGEGEHKILKFIRNMRDSPDFDPKWTHVIYSADADLIMLGLATHIKNFCLLRESPSWDKVKTQVAAKRREEESQFEFINLGIVREYMDLEFSAIKAQMKIPYNINRIIDDFLLIFFFVGNDFLPRVYCFDIRQGTVEVLIDSFKEFLKNTKSYVSDCGKISWESFSNLMLLLSKFEIIALERRADEMKAELKSNELDDASLRNSIEQELNLLNQIKKKYSDNDQLEARKQFYLSKCNIDITTNAGMETVHKMAFSYLQGMQFVLQYYYEGTPSWSWYYPFYYSPLCGDIRVFLLQQSNNIQIFFEQSQPFEPFKSLLLILPPNDKGLLPNAYGDLLLPNSPLRNPFDFYPSVFDIDPFGAIYEHQFIAKIPFVELDLIQKVYEAVDPTGLTEKEVSRNKFGSTYIYEHCAQKQPLITLLPGVFENSETPVSESQFDLNSKEACLQLLPHFKRIQTDLPRIPSLGIHKIKSFGLKECKKKTKQKQLMIEIESFDFSRIDKIEKLSNLKQSYFCYAGYPQQIYCEVICVMTAKSTLYLNKNSANTIEYLQNQNKESEGEQVQVADLKDLEVYDMLLQHLTLSLEEKGMLNQKLTGLAVVNIQQPILKRVDGQHYYNTFLPVQQIIPLEFLSDQKLLDQKDFNILSLQPIGPDSKVILLCPEPKELNGAIGFVKSLQKEFYIVSIPQTVPVVNTDSLLKVKQIEFYTLKYVANQLKVKEKTLLFILGSVEVQLFKQKQKNQELIAESLDIGFNVISSRHNTLVPELIRIHQAQYDAKGYQKFKQFEELEISEVLLRDILEYQTKLPELFSFLDGYSDEALKKLQRIQVGNLLPKIPDATKRVMLAYIWMLRLPSSSYLLKNVASQMVPVEQITKFQTQIMVQQSAANKTVCTTQLNLICENEVFIPPYFKDHPPIHRIGDRVVAINPELSNFGAYGTVVGVFDKGEIYAEILWDQPRFGLGNLGGKCSLLRGSIVKFLDVFNLTSPWVELVRHREQHESFKEWEYRQRVFAPKFETNPISGNDRS